MRYPCKECRATYRYAHDLEEHRRVGHVQSSVGPTWSDKDVEEAIEEAPEAAEGVAETPEVAEQETLEAEPPQE